MSNEYLPYSLPVFANVFVTRIRESKALVETAWIQRLKLNCGGLLSSFAFKFGLCRYMTAEVKEQPRQLDYIHGIIKVGFHG